MACSARSLGLAKKLGEAVGLVGTSGTAAANFLPAVLEAFYSRVPLVVLTADRPHEVREVGANQTIDQIRLYGEHVKWFFDLAEPHASPRLVRHARAVGARAAATAMAEPAGPVHLNCPFREPLIPDLSRRAAQAPVISAAAGRRTASPELVQNVASTLGGRRGLIVCGPQPDPELPPAVADLAKRLEYPILADPLSGVRYGPHDQSLVLDAYDAVLRGPIEWAAPEVIVRFGAVPTSKSLLQFLERHPSAQHLLVDGGGGWRDPTGLVTDIVHADPVRLSGDLVRALPEPAASSGWAHAWLRADRAARRAIDDHLSELDELFEGKVFARLRTRLPDAATVYVGNSMPVRDLDAFLASSPCAWSVLGNRGVSGIDGVVSSAMGASAARRGPVILVIGDLSFYHDMNGLLAARRHDLDLLAILLNNDGGGIFSFLPQAEQPAYFEELFGTPHGLDFEPFVEGYGGRFVRVGAWDEFDAAVTDGLGRGGLCVIEVPTNRARNVQLHREVWQTVHAALADDRAALRTHR